MNTTDILTSVAGGPKSILPYVLIGIAVVVLVVLAIVNMKNNKEDDEK